MAEKNLNVRLTLKYDTYENWSTNNPKLLAGEVAITTVSVKQEGTVNTVPAVMMKVGDNEHTYNELEFTYARAADVAEWAKAANKPTYAASEITGLDARIAEYVSEEMGIEVDTDTQYNMVKVNDYQYKLMSKSKGDESFATEVAVIDIPKYDDTTVKADIKANADAIDALELLVGETAVATQIANAITALNLANTYEAKGTAATEAGKVQTALNEYVEANDGVIAAIKDGETIDSFADVETALAGKQAVGDYATKAEAQAMADGKDEAIAAAKKAGDDAQADVDALEGVVEEINGKVTTNTGDITTMKGQIAALEAGTYDDTEVRGLIKANADAIDVIEGDYLKAADKTELQGNIDTVSGKVTTLIGDDANKSVRTIANEELAKQLITTDAAENLNSLEEIAAWIQAHPGDAAAMNAAITALQNQLKGIDAGEGTVKKYVDDAITALNVGQYALAADLTALAGRVSTLEGKVTTLEGASHSHDNKTVLDGITSDKVTAWDGAVAKEHEHTNKTVLDGITESKVTAWDAAEQNAKDYADGLAGNYDAKGSAAAAETNAKTYADGLNTAMNTRVEALEALPTNVILDTDTLILNCGDSKI